MILTVFLLSDDQRLNLCSRITQNNLNFIDSSRGDALLLPSAGYSRHRFTALFLHLPSGGRKHLRLLTAAKPWEATLKERTCPRLPRRVRPSSRPLLSESASGGSCVSDGQKVRSGHINFLNQLRFPPLPFAG